MTEPEHNGIKPLHTENGRDSNCLEHNILPFVYHPHTEVDEDGLVCFIDPLEQLVIIKQPDANGHVDEVVITKEGLTDFIVYLLLAKDQLNGDKGNAG